MAVVAVVLGLTFNKFLNQPSLTREQLSQMGSVVFETPRAVNWQELQDHQGRPFSNENLKKNWTLVYFGYTFCPDICPITLSQLNKLDAKLKEEDPDLAKKIHYVMVSVDPRRDTVEKLNAYVPYFNPDFVGITGDIKNIHNLAVQMNIPYTPVTDPEDEFYLVDHGANIAVINPRGDYHGFIRPPLEPGKLAQIMNALDEQF
ncbi:hypothetical protein ACH42_13810 [Endozoicomonas sp. (ex Bugula neritina AB1)]|nr:hypothetical protein ACH42_13810 [Endozoicomonas sp. (ex Bugula neritina AB1)]